MRGLNRAENARKRRATPRKNVEKFLRNPYGYSKQLFEQSKGGELTASKTEVEQHLKSVYSRTEAEQRGGSTASDEETHGSRVCV